jgi:5'-nucleotidase/UDP-sugar diphosphatase
MDGVALAPGTMRLSPAQPNPHAAADGLFLLLGDATTGLIPKVERDPGVAIPQPLNLKNHPISLRIFHFNDLHGHLMRFSALGEETILPRIAGKIKKTRQEAGLQPDSIVLVCSAGDDCTGSIFDEIMFDSQRDHPIHPGYQLYSKMGLDVAGLGNHDLDRGPQFMAETIKHNARFPVLAANLKGCSSLSSICHPAAILVVRGLRIGIIGLVTRAETNLDPHICQIVHPVLVAQNLVPALRLYCDVLIILSHLGYNMESPVPMADAGEVELAQGLPPSSVDLIIGGHSHTALNQDGLAPENIINGIPIVQAGGRGNFLGQVDLQVDQDGVKVTKACLIPTTSLPSDAAFEAEMQPYIARAREIWNLPVGKIEDIPDLNTQIVLTDFSKREMALANFVTDALVERMKGRGFEVDFAMIDASALQCGLPYRDYLTYGDCFDVMPFADTLRLYTLTGSQVQDLFDDNALRFDRPGEPDQERGFFQFSREVKYTLDPDKGHALDIQIHDTPIAALAEKTFRVVTTSFARRLAEPWEAAQATSQNNGITSERQVSKPAGRVEKKDALPTHLFDIHQFPFSNTDLLLRNEIVTYIQEHGGVSRQTGAHCDGRLKIESTNKINHKVHEGTQRSFS